MNLNKKGICHIVKYGMILYANSTTGSTLEVTNKVRKFLAHTKQIDYQLLAFLWMNRIDSLVTHKHLRSLTVCIEGVKGKKN